MDVPAARSFAGHVPRPPPRNLDSRAAIHQRLLALARQSELQRFVRTLAARDKACGAGRLTPVLLKIAPDLTEIDLDGIVTVALRRGIAGLIVSNTTLDRPASLRSPHRGETGGLSGRPVFARSTRLLAQAAIRIEGRMPLIGVGGVEDWRTALAKIEAGASLVQLYTAMIYKGPGLFGEITAGFMAHLARTGAPDMAALVGSRMVAIAAGEP
jgi:dihydroorotate dehydrogenase